MRTKDCQIIHQYHQWRIRSIPIVSFIIITFMMPFFLLAQSSDECLLCHEDKSLTMEKNGKTISIFVDHSVIKESPHDKLVCTACHIGFDPGNIPHKEKINPVNCLACHSDAQAKHPFHITMLRTSIGDPSLLASCKRCHGTHNVVSMKTGTAKSRLKNTVEMCGKCHAKEQFQYLASTHGQAVSRGVASAPDCISCHRSRITGLAGSPDSASIKVSQEKVCLFCHLDNPDVRERVSPSAGFIAAYERSVHGSALLNGKAAAANCVDCHGNHDIQREGERTSSVNRAHIPSTCAKCHKAIEKEYSESIHGKAALHGNKEAPVCTNCHGEHNILPPSNPQSPIAAHNVSQEVCSPCHNSVILNEKYGIARNQFRTFATSYHGLAIRAGSIEVANCASCHSAHNIKPSKDSTSTVNKANLAKTCGKCHPGTNARFTMGSIHIAMEKKEDPLLYWISYFYVLLISTLIGGMFFHNFIDFYRKSKRKLMIRRGLATEEYFGHSLYIRMTLNERIQHGLLLVSFFILVLTGFMLRYPDAFWVIAMRDLSANAFELRGLFHRIAAIVLIVTACYHVYYIFFTERGKQLLKDLLPKWKDITDAMAVFKYNIGWSQKRPVFGRFSYMEKSEYWALVWGTIVMAVTGIILWFDNTFMGLLTKLGWDVGRTIHFYEAWLAFLAIVVWHLYFVIFNPNIYLMNISWIKGTLTEAEMAEEHLLELESLKKEKLKNEESVIIVANANANEEERINQPEDEK